MSLKTHIRAKLYIVDARKEKTSRLKVLLLEQHVHAFQNVAVGLRVALLPLFALVAILLVHSRPGHMVSPLKALLSLYQGTITGLIWL